MDKTPENKLLSEWESLIFELSQKGQSVAIGIFGLKGNLLEANDMMCYFLDADINKLNPKNQFVNPHFSSLIVGKTDELIFEGLLTIGNLGNVSYVLNSKIFRRNDRIFVYAEADVAELFADNKKMSVLNQEVNNLQRLLIKEKMNLQNALSELKETQQMLIHSEKMNAMGKLVAGVAHELNNPIAFVYSNLFSLEKYMSEVFQSYVEVEELISKEGGEELNYGVAKIREKNDLNFLSDDIIDMVKESKVGIERVKAIVEDLRRFSRLDESEIKQIDLIENIRSTVSIARSEITRKNITFNLMVPDHLLIDCYPGQLNQAILNVLINAVYAVSVGGQITLSVTEDERNIQISVKDNGSGIPKEIKDRIFDPFFTTKPVGSGTGLGLSITYKIIHDLHHGSIEVESDPEKETVIKLIIPKNIIG